MSFQAYLDNIYVKTGKTPQDFREMAAEKGLVKHGEIVNWLKTDFGLGHGHANAIAAVLLKSDQFKAIPEDKLNGLFMGKKSVWREAYDKLAADVGAFGADVTLAPNLSYINLLRGEKKFGLVQLSSADRMDIGIKLKDTASVGRFEPAGTWNNMVTHRVRISAPEQVDAEVVAWLKRAYEAA
jgi:hypothetical protein